jgi:hypothetical protein
LGLYTSMLRGGSMIRIPVYEIEFKAAQRPAGYTEDCYSMGFIDGGDLCLTDESFAELIRRYRGIPVRTPLLLGDLVARLAEPFKRYVNIANCRCDARRVALNRFHMRVVFWLKRLTSTPF